MGQEDAIEMYNRLDHLGQARFLGLLGHELTIAARGWYSDEPADLKGLSELRQVIEMIHRILGHQIKLMNGDNGRYPDLVLFSMLSEMALAATIDETLTTSLSNVVRFMSFRE